MTSNSAWAVMSHVSFVSFTPVEMTSPSFTKTAPNGLPPFLTLFVLTQLPGLNTSHVPSKPPPISLAR